MNIYHLLGSNGFWVVNKKLAKKVGIDAAILIADLISKRQYFIENSDIKIDEFFFNTRENIEIDTTLTAFQQRAAERILVEEGFLVVEIKGLPAKNYYKVVDSKLLSFFTAGSKESSQQEVKKLDGNNNKEIITQNNNKERIYTPTLSISETINESKRFEKPTIEAVKEYFKENGYSEKSAETAWHYYDSANWVDSQGKKVRNWKQKMRGVWFKHENKQGGNSQSGMVW